MIYLIDKKEVKLGEKVTIGNITLTLTQEIVDENPDLFEVKDNTPKYIECVIKIHASKGWWNVGDIYKVLKWTEHYLIVRNNCGDTNGFRRKALLSKFKPSTKEAYDLQELLKEAKKRYPIGTKFKSAGSMGNIHVVEGNPLSHASNAYPDAIANHGFGLLYANGKWAEIIKPLFTTEDGVAIYEGDTIYRSQWTNNIPNYRKDTAYERMSKSWTYFSTIEAAEAWIEANKPKFLEDYEQGLLFGGNKSKLYITRTSDGKANNSSLYSTHFYTLMKEFEPKLYYFKVLQLIADDLNGDWKPKDTPEKWCIRQHSPNMFSSTLFYKIDCGQIYFKSKLDCDNALSIITPVLDKIFI